MTVVLSQVVFWINKESVPARTVAGICIFPFVIHLISFHFISFTVLNPLYQSTTIIQGGLGKAASRFQSAKLHTKVKPSDSQFAYEDQNS